MIANEASADIENVSLTPTARTAERGKPDPYPTVSRVLADGSPALQVSLSGSESDGASFLIDPETWGWVAREFGAAWRLNSNNNSGRLYVSSQRKLAGQRAHQNCRCPKAILARLIIGGGRPLQPRRAVAYKNGDTCDLRRVNLEEIPRGACGTYRPNCPLPVVVEADPIH